MRYQYLVHKYTCYNLSFDKLQIETYIYNMPTDLIYAIISYNIYQNINKKGTLYYKGAMF